jgi:hypothetical protein
MTSRRLNRAEIEAIVGKDLRAIRAFERLLADVQANISGPSNVVLNYNSDGTIASPLPVAVQFQLVPQDGTAFTSGVSWGVTVLSGTFTGSAPTIGGTGTGTVLINSGITSPTATIGVTARVDGRGYPPFTVTISKLLAPPDGGGGGLTPGDSTSTLQTITGTSFAAITRDLVVTLPAAVTAATLTAADISLTAASASPFSTTTIEAKWQREVSPGTWGDVGAVATSSPNPIVTVEGSDFIAEAGSITCNRTETGLTPATQETFRLVARISAGTTRNIFCAGTVSVSS